MGFDFNIDYPLNDFLEDLKGVNGVMHIFSKEKSKRSKNEIDDCFIDNPDYYVEKYYRDKYGIDKGFGLFFRFRAINLFLKEWQTLLEENELFDPGTGQIKTGLLNVLLKYPINEETYSIPEEALSEIIEIPPIIKDIDPDIDYPLEDFIDDINTIVSFTPGDKYEPPVVPSDLPTNLTEKDFKTLFYFSKKYGGEQGRNYFYRSHLMFIFMIKHESFLVEKKLMTSSPFSVDLRLFELLLKAPIDPNTGDISDDILLKFSH